MERKALVFSTLAAAFVLFGAAASYQILQDQEQVVINTNGALSLGNPSAPIEIVLIEDFQCKNCRTFSQKIIPKIQSTYLKTGQVRFTLVPVSFLLGSQEIANAALEVYKQQPDRFLTYLKEILSFEGEVKRAELVKLAKKVGGIDLTRLDTCIQIGCHNIELQNNLNWAQNLMGARFRTPALFINGVPGSTFSFEAIQYQIEQILGNQ